jgi:predicted phage terminase large subunit-like protein
MIEALTDVASGVSPKLMLWLPPGSAKSTYGSVLFPPWFMAQDAGLSVLAASHSEELADRWGRRCRNLIEEHAGVLGIDVSQTNRAAGRWQLAGGQFQGEYMAAGVGSAIAGFRGDLGLIDDPVRGREEVLQEGGRERVWQWYLWDYLPRLKPNARQVVIMTRWATDDLAGRILEAERGEWRVLSLPMVAEDVDDPLGRQVGDRLWPEWFTDAMVRQAMEDPAKWLSLYQQRPVDEQGTFWKRHWFNPVPHDRIPPRDTLRVYGGSDYAVKAESHNDYTCHAVVALDSSDRPWILDLWRQRTTSDIWVSSWCDLVRLWRPLTWAEEHGQIEAGVGPWLERESLKRHAFTERLQFPTRGDKGVRAQSMRGLVAAKGLWYSATAPWREELEAELVAFPAGRHDDQHDALGLVGQLLDNAIRGREPVVEKPKPKTGYRQMGLRTGPSLHTL